MSEPNIYQRINAVMTEVEYVKKDAKVEGYKAVTHDQVTSVIRKSLVKNGIVVQLEQLKSEILVKRDLDKGIKMHLYSGDYAVHFVNMDKPEDRLTVCVNAHAADNGDKAPGKCASYATKYAMLKTFTLETGENDESRTYEAPQFTDMQKSEFDDIIASGDALKFLTFTKTIGEEAYSALVNSFEKGKISAGKAKVRELEMEGWKVINSYTDQIREYIDNEDPALAELIDELEPIEKKLVANGLTQKQIEYLRNFNR